MMKRTLALFILFSLVRCGVVSDVAAKKNSEGSKDSPVATREVLVPDAAAGPRMVAMFTLTQMRQVFADATKISITDNDVKAAYALADASMPKDPTIDLTPSMLGAVMRYADANCQKLVAKEAGQTAAARLFFREVNFGSNTSQAAFTNKATFTQMWNRVAQRFWGRVADPEEVDIAFDAVQATKAEETSRDLTGMLCVIAGSSQETIQL